LKKLRNKYGFQVQQQVCQILSFMTGNRNKYVYRMQYQHDRDIMLFWNIVNGVWANTGDREFISGKNSVFGKKFPMLKRGSQQPEIIYRQSPPPRTVFFHTYPSRKPLMRYKHDPVFSRSSSISEKIQFPKPFLPLPTIPPRQGPCQYPGGSSRFLPFWPFREYNSYRFPIRTWGYPRWSLP